MEKDTTTTTFAVLDPRLPVFSRHRETGCRPQVRDVDQIAAKAHRQRVRVDEKTGNTNMRSVLRRRRTILRNSPADIYYCNPCHLQIQTTSLTALKQALTCSGKEPNLLVRGKTSPYADGNKFTWLFDRSAFGTSSACC